MRACAAQRRGKVTSLASRADEWRVLADQRSLASGLACGRVEFAVRKGRAGFHRLVVLKRMLEEGGDEPAVMLQRFIGEARTAARLHHPNIVSVYDIGQIEGGWFIVME